MATLDTLIEFSISRLQAFQSENSKTEPCLNAFRSVLKTLEFIEIAFQVKKRGIKGGHLSILRSTIKMLPLHGYLNYQPRSRV